jgi:hypothetical protein
MRLTPDLSPDEVRALMDEWEKGRSLEDCRGRRERFFNRIADSRKAQG